jgi:hypothetical protein
MMTVITRVRKFGTFVLRNHPLIPERAFDLLLLLLLLLQGYQCTAGFSCVREHQWFWSCRPTKRH